MNRARRVLFGSLVCVACSEPDAGALDGSIGDAASADAGEDAAVPPSDQWRALASTDDRLVFTQLELAGNARGDNALFWLLGAEVTLAYFTAAAGVWDGVKLRIAPELQELRVSLPALKVLSDGTAIAVWQEAIPFEPAAKLSATFRRNGLWTAPTEVASLDYAADGRVTDLVLVANDAGHVAVGVRTDVTELAIFTLSFGEWSRFDVPYAQGAPRMTLDDAGVLSVLYAARGPSIGEVSYDFATELWSDERVVVETPNERHLCASSSDDCYHVARGGAGPAVALVWDPMGVAAEGSLRAFHASEADWIEAAAPLSANASSVFLLGDARGDALALYRAEGELKSRRFRASSLSWEGEESGGDLAPSAVMMNRAGEALAVGVAPEALHVRAHNFGGGWSEPEPLADQICDVQETEATVSDDAVMLAQFCLTAAGSFPMFVRVRRIAFGDL